MALTPVGPEQGLLFGDCFCNEAGQMVEIIYFIILSVQYIKLGIILPSISFLSKRENKHLF